MKRKGSITLGPGAASLILIFVVLALSMLSVLALMNSRSDVRLGRRSIEVTEDVYALNAASEASRAQLDAILAEAQAQVLGGEQAGDSAAADDASRKNEAGDVAAEERGANEAESAATDAEYLQLIAQRLPAEMEMEGREIRWTETDGVRNLHCAIEVQPLGSEVREVWVQHTLAAAAAEEAEGGLVEFD